MDSSDIDICTPLPSSITNQITTCNNSEQYVINFLQNQLPASDASEVTEALRKNFLLNKYKIKQKHRRKRRGKLLTNKKRMELGLRKVGCRDEIKYNDLLPLHELWLKYMDGMLGSKFFTNTPTDPIDSTWENVNQQLIKADFHGAKILVVRSKCPSLVGLGGIVIQDTKNVFRVCGEDNIIRTIPKDVILLNMYLRSIKLQIFGKEISIKPAERTVKKLKSVRAFDLTFAVDWSY